MKARAALAIVVALLALGAAEQRQVISLGVKEPPSPKDCSQPACPQPVCPAPSCPQPVCPTPSCPALPTLPAQECPNKGPSCPNFLWKVLATYDHFQGFGFYKAYKPKANWNRAKAICEADGGHLGIINSNEEANIFRFLFRKYGLTEWAFIGIHNLEGGQWKTVTGVPLAQTGYVVWMEYEPSGGEEHCGTIGVQGTLNDIRCHWEFGFICEVSERKVFGQ